MLHIHPRAARLKEETTTTHERLDAMIMAAEPFASVENYTQFLRLQHAFHRDVAPLYRRADLAALIPNLASLARADAVTADLRALGQNPPAYDDAPAGETLSLPEALGWLYVVEGSNLGAAFLFKAAKKMGLSAEHGASHLDEAPEGRAAHWRAFKDALDAAEIDADAEFLMVQGARAAFDRVRALAMRHLHQQQSA